METSDHPRRISGISLIVFLLLSLSIIGTGWMFYVREKTYSVKNADQAISAIADLKISQIVNWRKERLADASVISTHPFNTLRIAPFLENPSPEDAGNDIRAWMETLKKSYDYEDAALTDTEGNVKLSLGVDDEDIHHHLKTDISEAVRTKKPVLSDFHRSEHGTSEHKALIHICLFVPLLIQPESRVAGILMLRIDPNLFLYPLIQSWHTPSPSAETLLIRRNSHEVLFLNELRHKKNTALSLRLPITDKELPAAKAVLGFQGIFEGRDYRGIPVLADVRRIPDSNWAMVAKVDQEEIFAPLFARIRMIWAAGSVLILLIGLFFLFQWKKREAEFYLQEIQERKQAEEALRESRRQTSFFADLLECSSQAFGVGYPDGRLGLCNTAYPQMLGYTKEELMSLDWKDITPSEWLPEELEKLNELHRTGQPVRYEKEYFRKDGSRVPVELFVHLVRDENGAPLHYYSFITDISERKKAEESLQIRLKMREYADTHTMDDLLQYLLDQTERVTGSQIGFFHFFDEEQKELTLQAWSGNTIRNMCTAQGKGAHYPVEQAGVWADCVRQRRPVIHNDYAALPNRNAMPEGHAPVIRELTLPVIRNDRIVAIIGMGNKSADYTETDVQIVSELTNIAWDVISRKQTEESLQLNEQRYRKAQEMGHVGNWEYNLKTSYFWGSDEAKRIYGFDPEQDNFSTDDVENCIPEREWVHQALVDLIEHGKEYHLEFEIRPKNSHEPKFISSIAELKRDENGNPLAVVGVIQDITERRMLEDVQLFLLKYDYMSSGEDFFRALARYLAEKLFADFVCIDKLENENLSAKTLAVWSDGRFEDDISYTLKDTPCGEVVGKTICSFPSGVRDMFPKDEVLQQMNAESYVGTTLRNSEGRSIGLIALIWRNPVTNMKLAETILKLVSVRAAGESERRQLEEEREKLENQLRQAQKMEAIGQLAGGVAHDFNNLLYVITGYADMMLEELPPDGHLHSNMKEIMKAAQRAATLVRQLLLFSRREAMQMKILNLNDLISELIKMLRRVIGEHITLEFLPGFDLMSNLADPGQIEQVLMNLCVNARDAMPGGGRIVIETENIFLDAEYCRYNTWAKEGDYVLLKVSDTGCGIPHEIQEHIFEPFFTTKEVGKGTGLGLAAVYGIIRSHQGMIRVYSEPGQGAAFKVYLSAEKDSRVSPNGGKESEARIAGGSETVLVAEDEEAVRNMIVHILKKAGYRVLAAKDGEEAIGLFEKHSAEIDLALLDVIMPKIGGQKIYEHIRKIRPDMPVIFSTGYSRGILNSHTFPDERYDIIQKPVSPIALLRKIREVLDSK